MLATARGGHIAMTLSVGLSLCPSRSQSFDQYWLLVTRITAICHTNILPRLHAMPTVIIEVIQGHLNNLHTIFQHIRQGSPCTRESMLQPIYCKPTENRKLNK